MFNGTRDISIYCGDHTTFSKSLQNQIRFGKRRFDRSKPDKERPRAINQFATYNIGQIEIC